MRTVEREMEIDAPVEAVWRALTDASELMRWFPPEAEVTPGEGGEVRLMWGEHWDGRCAIEIWKPNEHLRYTWMENTAPPDVDTGQPSKPLLVDFLLEGKGGTTVLRLVHTGFGPDADWDAMYDGVRRGWLFELCSLKHYLERRHGRDRQFAWFHRRPKISRDAAWRTLLSAGGLFSGATGLDDLYMGERFTVTTPSGEPFTGVVEIFGPPKDFAARVDQLDGGLFRLHIDEYTDPGLTEVYLSISTWGMDDATAKAIARHWEDALDRVLPKSRVVTATSA